MPAAAGEMRRPNLPRGCVDDLQRGLGCVELIAQLSPPGVSDKKPSTFVDVAFHPLKPWVAAIEPKGCGVVWDYDTGEVVTEFDLGESQVLDDEELHGSEPGDEAAAEVDPVGNYNLSTTPKGLLSRASASASSRAVQGAVVAGTNAVAAAKGIMSPSGASIIKRRRTTLNMLFYDHEAIAYMTQLPAPRTCFDEWLLIVTRAHIVICDLSQNGAVHHLDPEDLHRGLPTSVAILPSGLLAIGCQDGKIRIWSPWQSKTVGTLDSGSQRDVQQLVLLTTPPIVVKRSGSGVLPGAETRLSTQLHHLACATLDGHVVTWRVSLNASTASCDCVKTFEVELRDVFRSFDTVNGVHELKFHPHHDVMTAACRDGTVFFFDVAPMLDNNKPPTLTGLVPNSKLQSVLVLPSVQKGGFQVLSMAPLNSTLLISEVGVKGRYGGKDNVPTIFTEFTTTNSQESRDLRGFVTPMPPKRLKLVSLTTSVRHPGELCCLTNYGLLVLRITCLASPKPVFIPRGLQSAPAIGFPSSMIIGLRLLGEDPQMKPQFQMIQNNGETSGTIERLRVPDLHYHSWQHGFLAAIVPVSGHLEIFQLGLKPVPPKAVDLETIFVAHAFGFAWHPSQPLFAVLAPNKELSGKITRSNTASAIVPSRRSRFFFGGNRTSAAAANDEADTRQQRAATRSLTLSIYKLTGDDAEVEFLETSFLSGEDHVLHIFPGPLLGVVKFVAPADTSSVPDVAALIGGGAIVKRARDSPASLSRIQRAQSFMLGLSTMSSPKMSDLRMTMISPAGSPSASPTAASVESIDPASDITKTFLEFYEWGHIENPTEGEPALRKLSGGFAVDCPLSLEWDSSTRNLCALVYPSCIKIYHFKNSGDENVGSNDGSASTMECLHEIPTPTPALSLHWMHRTLFFSTEDEVMCCVIAQTRCFTLALASRWVLNEASCATHLSDDDLSQFPRPQIFPAGATTILGVRDEKLVLGGPLHAVHILDLSNRLLQCAMLVTAGSIDQAAQLAQSLSPDATQWLGAVFEAFGHAEAALRLLPGLSLELKVNMCIKHTLLEPLSRLLNEVVADKQQRDSTNLTGSSLFQRSCIALHRGGTETLLKQLGSSLLAQKRYNDAIFVASLLQNDEQLIQAYGSAGEWGAAFHVAKGKTASTRPPSVTPIQNAILQKWNASVAKPTANWRTVLEKQDIRPPTTLKLAAPSK